MLIMAFILSLCPSLRNVTYFSFRGFQPSLSPCVCTVVFSLQFSQFPFDFVSISIIQLLKSSHGSGKAKIFQWPSTAGGVFLSALGLIGSSVYVCVLFFVFVLKFWNICNSRKNSRTWQTVRHRLLSLARSSLSTIW